MIEMSEKVLSEEIKIISPDPRIAEFLAQRKNTFIPKEVYEFGVSWIRDVGKVMRSREFLVSSVASYASYGIILALSEKFPQLKGMRLLSRTLGIG